MMLWAYPLSDFESQCRMLAATFYIDLMSVPTSRITKVGLVFGQRPKPLALRMRREFRDLTIYIAGPPVVDWMKHVPLEVSRMSLTQKLTFPVDFRMKICLKLARRKYDWTLSTCKGAVLSKACYLRKIDVTPRAWPKSAVCTMHISEGLRKLSFTAEL